jgi:hypothetical protein
LLKFLLQAVSCKGDRGSEMRPDQQRVDDLLIRLIRGGIKLGLAIKAAWYSN